MPTETEQIGVAPGPVYLVDALRLEDRQVLEQAYVAMTKILNSDEYKTKMNEKMLRAGCLSQIKVSGDTVIDDLKTKTIPVTLRKKDSYNANATTNIVKRRMRIDPDRFDNWNVSPEKQAIMLNTLIHETTHLVPYDKETPPGKNWYYKYYDQGHNSNQCYDSDLVSYVAGNTAEEIWLLIHMASK